MNKGIIIAGVGVLILAGGGLLAANLQPQKTDEVKTAQKVTGTMTPEQEAIEKSAGSKYVEYSKNLLGQAEAGRRVLFFYANWCPTCRPTDADLNANKNRIPEDLIVIRVNYNDSDTDQDEKELAKRYAVTYQHTFVQIDAQGREVAKWNGGDTDELLAKVK